MVAFVQKILTLTYSPLTPFSHSIPRHPCTLLGTTNPRSRPGPRVDPPPLFHHSHRNPCMLPSPPTHRPSQTPCSLGISFSSPFPADNLVLQHFHTFPPSRISSAPPWRLLPSNAESFERP
ncbi:hypothetical protein HNY73_020588 [Argiope bruennichi]|uniref:Uncharacterized protein n=1 Tax=Argiope bruennichi TaxID=94029 RepID=A0A8T0E8E2_ARGBR|nr:hypothetical protein HNY73_020588 [Argiope bruennichi]